MHLALIIIFSIIVASISIPIMMAKYPDSFCDYEDKYNSWEYLDENRHWHKFNKDGEKI